MFTYKDVLKNAVKDLWQDSSCNVEDHFFEAPDIAEAIHNHDGDIIVDENDPLYDDITVDGKVTRDGLLFILEN